MKLNTGEYEIFVNKVKNVIDTDSLKSNNTEVSK